MNRISAVTGLDSIQKTKERATVKPWEIRKSQNENVGSVYAGAAEFERYAARMADCSGWLRFDLVDGSLKFKGASFCRVRSCPVCQWRRSLMLQARFYKKIPELFEADKSARWLFITLTVRNCVITELGETLDAMNTAWARFVKRKEFSGVRGWVRATEVTRGKDDSAHPHFHVLAMVPPSMLAGRGYVKHSAWVELWRDCLRVDYLPMVDVRRVNAGADFVVSEGGEAAGVKRAVREVFKYAVKPSDMTRGGGGSWLLELTRQTHGRRFLAAGGVLRSVLAKESSKVDREESTENGADLVSFGWRESEQRYRKTGD